MIFTPSADRSLSPTNIFATASIPTKWIFERSFLVLSITAAIFLVVFTLAGYTVLKFWWWRHGDGHEAAQVYRNQPEPAWTLLPVLIALVLFLETAQELRAEDSDQN
jgi:heme/copper-type cytochrome/quinol oxidase subunit 2